MREMSDLDALISILILQAAFVAAWIGVAWIWRKHR